MNEPVKRKRFKKKPRPSEWIACISCGHERYREPYDGSGECPICESKEYEPADSYPLLTIRDDYNDYF